MADNVYRELFLIQGKDFQTAGEASSKVRNILKEIGIHADIVRRAAIVAFEAEMNCVMYANRGEFRFVVTPDHVILSIEDQGPGIEDIDQAMQEGYSTAPPEYREMGFGAGMGLPNMKKNSDEFRVSSVPGHGTKIESVLHVSGGGAAGEEQTT
jgi:anti-sigma regulatory factor (Ser/Thr protein kinase)